MRAVDPRVLERIRRRLERLYGPEPVPRLMSRLELIVGRYGVGKDCPPDVQCTRWDQTDAVLICYGDMVQGSGEPPLATLRRFLSQRVGDAVSAVHVLPFFPYSSDDGFSVIDYRAVDPALGDWHEIQRLAGEYRLMVDLVINHVSSRSSWFRAYCNGIAPERHYFIEIEPGTDLSAVTRPRTSPLLRPVQTPSGERRVWCTFSHDQIDVDFRNPDVLFEFLDILLFYVHNGAQIIRLDAIAYLWKELGTSCIHRPETHQVVKLLRDVLEMLQPGILLLTETNVPHAENVSYFGDGDEAHMVYQFSLPPLLLHALHTGDASFLVDWARRLAPPPAGCTFVNFTASHDGIGVRPLEGLLPDSEIDALVAAMEQRGGLVGRRSTPDGPASPYELNITYFDALRVPGDPDASVDRFLCSQTLALGLQGIPGIYFSSLLGASNDLALVEATGRARSINRGKWTEAKLDEILSAESGHQARRVFPEYLRRLRIRATQPALHPDAAQQLLDLPPGLFGLRRDGAAGQRLWMVANLSGRAEELAMGRIEHNWRRHRWVDLLGGWHSGPNEPPTRLPLAPYQVVWLVVADEPPPALG